MRRLFLALTCLLASCEPERPPPSYGPPNAVVELVVDNQMGNSFRLRRLVARIDQGPFTERLDDQDSLANAKEIPLGSVKTTPGEHELQLEATFQGNGFGVFKYLQKYEFHRKQKHPFVAVIGRTISIHCRVYEQGGATTPLEQRPAIECEHAP